MNRPPLTLGQTQFRVFPGFRVRIEDSVRHTVVFIGYPSNEAGKGGIDCVGTAFLLSYEGFPYLVTARHVAEYVGSDPFLLRVNRFDGSADNLPIDGAAWHYDSDPTVDVAVLPITGLLRESEHYVRFIDDRKETWWSNKAGKYGAGIGDFCYTVGLFRVLSGSKQNLPVVHFGTIARPIYGSDDEPIPIKDWRDPAGKKTILTNAYLVESQSLSGLSGAPVFVRTTNHHVSKENIEANPNFSLHELGDAIAMWHIHLIGIWQGAWDAPVGDILSTERGKGARVPVGMGVVVPIDHVHYILANEELTRMRKNRAEKAQADIAATLDLARSPAKPAFPASDENPQHREDFTSLLNAAAQKQKPTE